MNRINTLKVKKEIIIPKDELNKEKAKKIRPPHRPTKVHRDKSKTVPRKRKYKEEYEVYN